MKREEGLKHKESNGKLRPLLSQPEMSERMAKVLCYYCDEKFTPEHFQKYKKTTLFSMNFEEETELEMVLNNQEEVEHLDREVVQISINAIAGISDYTTMKVKGMHGNVLIYSGSTHNFIDSKVAELLGCRVREAGRAKVAVADGTRSMSLGVLTTLNGIFMELSS